jgi:hypothetical protein
MSDVFTKRRPMIDLDEFERRLCPPPDQKDDDPLAELLRTIDGKDESHETDFEPKTPLSARARQDAAHVRLVGGDFAAIEAGLLGTMQPQAAVPSEAETANPEHNEPNTRAPLISGDFAAIEAGLLGAPGEQATATVSETNMSNAFLSTDIGSQRFLHQDNQPVSRHAGVADGQSRSRRPLFVMVAIVIVAMAGIAVSFGFKSRASGPPEIVTFKAESGAAKQQTEATSNADVPVQDAAILSKPPEPTPIALDNGTKQPIDLPQVEEKTLPAESHAQIDNRPPAVPSAPAQAQTPTEPVSMAAPIESEKMKTGLVRPDGTLPPNATPPQANLNATPLPAPQSPAAAEAPRAKALGHVPKPLKPATARNPRRHGQPREIANEPKAKPVSPINTVPAPIGDPKAAIRTTQPSPGTNGAFGFVQSAVNSLTSATAKLLEWGRIETGSRP